MLDKKYNPTVTENAFYKLWEKEKAFTPSKKGDPYTIIMPPANVTGNLHLGHALTFTLQDVLVRFHRMLGRSVLWQPGTDHAGIATQMVVERELQKENKKRQDMGREAFLSRVWDWKEKSGGAIIHQLKRLGASADWSRERFTMDDRSNENVRQCFVKLYKDGLIYKDKRLVNWDVKYQTAISDVEVIQKEIKSKFYYIAYPLASGEGHITIATTRPETLFGDVAVAVHPEDEKYKNLIGQKIIIPVSGRRIPIIADHHSDPEKGTGAVKITPAHDFNDFEVGQRHDLPLYVILDVHNKLSGEFVPEDYQGLSCDVARKKIVDALNETEQLVKVETLTHSVPHGDRSDLVIEPRLTDQWYVDAKTLAQKAMQVVRDKKTVFVPENWLNVYFEWMENIQPWCVSRQLWWGHEIPAWYGPDGDVFVAEHKKDALREAKEKYGKDVDLKPETDVLDTWFSSGLWPIVTLDGFENDPVFQKRYPTSVLVTGFDIIFFWVARMMMLGLYFTGDVPFKEVYMHTLVRDSKGQKMSKSKGNVIDPLYLIDQYGADAVRYTLASMAAPGRDIKLGEDHVSGSRNFTTKIWNATRYALMSGAAWSTSYSPKNVAHPLNQWIIAELQNCQDKVTDSLKNYRFHEASSTIYHFLWGTYCDWYLELTKPLLVESDSKTKKETQETMGWVLGILMHIMHPIMPYISEEIWKSLGGEGLLISADWPTFEKGDYQKSQQDINFVTEMIGTLRSLRAELSIATTHLLEVGMNRISQEMLSVVTTNAPMIQRLGRVKIVPAVQEEKAVEVVVGREPILVDVADAFDAAAEEKRLEKELARIEKELEKVEQKLGNKQIVEKAPKEILDELYTRQLRFTKEQAAYEQSREKLKKFL